MAIGDTTRVAGVGPNLFSKKKPNLCLIRGRHPQRQPCRQLRPRPRPRHRSPARVTAPSRPCLRRAHALALVVVPQSGSPPPCQRCLTPSHPAHTDTPPRDPACTAPKPSPSSPFPRPRQRTPSRPRPRSRAPLLAVTPPARRRAPFLIHHTRTHDRAAALFFAHARGATAMPMPAGVGAARRNGRGASSVGVVEVLGNADGGSAVSERAGRGAWQRQTAKAATAWMTMGGGEVFFFKKIDLGR